VLHRTDQLRQTHLQLPHFPTHPPHILRRSPNSPLTSQCFPSLRPQHRHFRIRQLRRNHRLRLVKSPYSPDNTLIGLYGDLVGSELDPFPGGEEPVFGLVSETAAGAETAGLGEDGFASSGAGDGCDGRYPFAALHCIWR